MNSIKCQQGTQEWLRWIKHKLYVICILSTSLVTYKQISILNIYLLKSVA